MQPYSPQKLPISGIDWESLANPIGRANRAVGNFGGILRGLPNPEVLLSPLVTQEAVLSSRIEGTIATLSEVLRFEAGEESFSPEKQNDIYEIVNYRVAMLTAEKLLRTKPFHLNLLLKLHSILLDSVRGRDKGRGRFRTIQNWIGRPNTSVEQATFVPPSPSVLPEYLDNWEKYYHADRPDPLVQLSIIHAQFEILHPFLDGNGRLGRMLIPLFLYEKKILFSPVFYISEFLEKNREEYVTSLQSISVDSDWNQWIMFFLESIAAQAGTNALKAKQILELYNRLKSHFLEQTHSQYAIPLLDFMFRAPVFSTTQVLEQPHMPTRATVFQILRKLVHDGSLKIVRAGSGRRPQVFALPELINLCEGRKVFV